MEYLKMEFSEKVADALEHNLIPWRLPALPRNILNQKFYVGINPILLGIAAARFNFVSPWWGTYAQWQAFGCKVRQPDVLDWGARIVLYKQIIRSKMEESCLVRDVVYNWEQTDKAKRPSAELPEQNPEAAFQAIVSKGGVNIEYGYDNTCKYIGADDKIRMPNRWMFEIGPGGVSGYYDAQSHELFHWTERRVGWDGSEDMSELRAEIGGSYLCAALGVKPLPRHLARHHDKFVGRWVKLMRTNPRMLFDICENVTVTLGFLFGFAGREPAFQYNAHNVVPHG